jgi:2-polyprenyl-3-methyl-5-hydroxy-6-metoxy-1,4-benzoquinol methylase
MDWKAFWNDSAQVRDPDFHRQVGRTLRGVAYSDREMAVTVDRLLAYLQPAPGKTLLDIACGNGLITSRLATHFAHATGIDFSQPLIAVAQTHFRPGNVDYLVGDASELPELPRKYDCVLVSAALQHFDGEQARRMLRRVQAVIKPGARIVLSDVADGDRIWNFYRGFAGRLRYAAHVLQQRPVIGHWWKPATLLEIADEFGWLLSIHYQTHDNPNHYFRYDAVLVTPPPSTPT